MLEEYRRRGLGHRLGFGVRPAVVVVDLIRAFTDPASPLGCDLGDEIQATVRLLQAARDRRLPVVFITTGYAGDLSDAGLFVDKVPSLRILQRGGEWGQIDPRLCPQEQELVVEKQYASAFFATPLASTLTAGRVDTVLIAGCTTSGCIRATVVDALQHGFRPIVPRQCVGDRAVEAHEASLFDIEAKYGDVVGIGAAVDYLAQVDPTQS